MSQNDGKKNKNDKLKTSKNTNNDPEEASDENDQ